MSDRHVEEAEIEALAHGRPETVDRAVRAHVGACSECAGLIAEARALSDRSGELLRAATPEVPDLDAMIAGALAHAERATAPAVLRPSIRAVVISAVVGLVATVALAVASVPSIAGVIAALRDAYALVGIADRIVGGMVPGGWTTVTVAGLLLLVLLAAPLRLLAKGTRSMAADGGVISLLFPFVAILCVLGGAPQASALELEGEWPEDEQRVSVSVDQRPTSEVLRTAAESAGLGFASTLPDDPVVTLHVRDASLRDVVEAVLGDADVVARRTPTMLIVRPAAASGAVTAAPPPEPEAPPPVPQPPPPPPASREHTGDRVTFGNDVVVRAGERVRDVVTMGGDVEVYGEVLGEIATMGGDVQIHEGGTVHRGIFTMGGDVEVHDRAAVHGEIGTMGGDLTTAEGASVAGGNVRIGGFRHASDDERDDRDHGSAVGRWLEDALWTAAQHALLFVLGVLLLAIFPERIAALQRVIVGSPVRAGVSGLLGFVGTVVLSLILIITIIGIPGAVIVALGAFAAFYIGIVSTATVVGAALPLGFLKNRPLLQLAAGIVALYLASLVPVVGTLVGVVVAALGFGAVILTRFRKHAPGELPQA